MKQIEIDVGFLPGVAETGSPGDAQTNQQQSPETDQVAAVGAPVSSDGASREGVQDVPNAPGEESLFFPCNREDALLLLGSLCISDFFPDASVRLAIQPEGIALLDQGLRGSEEELIKGGRPERFPVLIEVAHHVGDRNPRAIEYGDVLGLVLRTQSEAEQFRYRPVEEFDTETFECRADGALFGLPGDSRFNIRGIPDKSKLDAGRVVDRLSAGVHSVLALGNARPDCRAAIAEFLGREPGHEPGNEEMDFATAGDILVEAQPGTVYSKHQRAIVSAFASFEGTSSRMLIEEVAKNFSSLSGGDEDAARKESRWIEIAGDVIRSRIALGGDQLSDDRSVLLRGALLGLAVDKADALFAFLDAEKPSGPRVTTTAAFLAGLKQGVMNSSWKEKKPNVEALSSLARILTCGVATSPDKLANTLTVSKRETESTSTLSISAGDISLAEWTTKREVPPDGLSQLWIDDFQSFGYEVLGRGRSGHSWRLRLAPAHEVELTHCACGTLRFPLLRFYLENGQKLRRAKELVELSRKGGVFWYPGIDEEGRAYLSCDLPVLPDGQARELIWRKLMEALDAFLVPAKVARQSAKKKPQ